MLNPHFSVRLDGRTTIGGRFHPTADRHGATRRLQRHCFDHAHRLETSPLTPPSSRTWSPPLSPRVREPLLLVRRHRRTRQVNGNPYCSAVNRSMRPSGRG